MVHLNSGRWYSVGLGLSLFLLGASLAKAAPNKLSLWTRRPGSYSDDQNPTKGRPLAFDLEHAHLVQKRMLDVQYGRTATYRGLALSDLVKAYKAANHDDTIILHFANGMAVPVPLAGDDLARLDAFVAVEVCPKKNACTKDFAEVAKEDAFSVTSDPRPITFSWNKLVVPTLWHPEVPEARQQIFTPWHHVDTLTGIEFVNAAAYFHQFEIGEAEGLSVFRERCQYCHGVRE